MNRKIKYIGSLAISFLIALSVNAQSDSLKQSDSLNARLLKEYDSKLKLIEKQRIEDSIKKAELESQLSQLKTTDNLKKEELQKQLQEINAKEAQRIADKKLRLILCD